MSPQKIILPGGSGLLGALLAAYLASRHRQVVILSRHPAPPMHPNIRALPWDGRSLHSSWTDEFESAAAVINLAGRSVNCRYTAKNRRRIFDSRILSTTLVGQAIAQCQNPPPVWLNASTATIYKHAFTPMDERTGIIAPTPEARDAFSIRVATAWEKALADAPAPRTRKIPLRTAMVLAPGKNSVFPILRALTRFGLGGTIGPGTQFVSWIHHFDFCRAVEFLLDRPDLAGPVNLAAPSPLTNAEFMKTFRQIFRRPFGLPTPAPVLKLAAFFLRTEPELLLKSRCVLPTRLAHAHFTFQFPTFAEALRNLESTANRR